MKHLEKIDNYLSKNRKSIITKIVAEYERISSEGESVGVTEDEDYTRIRLYTWSWRVAEVQTFTKQSFCLSKKVTKKNYKTILKIMGFKNINNFLKGKYGFEYPYL